MTEHTEPSHKVLATVAIINALEYSQEELEDLTGYLAHRCGLDLQSDLKDYDAIDEARTKDTSLLEGLTWAEILEKGNEELKSMAAIQIALPPVDAYNIVAIVQAAIMTLDLPEHSEATGRDFVNAFCDRYRDQMPTIVQCINSGWDENYLVNEEESEENLNKTWERIAREVEEETGCPIHIIRCSGLHASVDDDDHDDFMNTLLEGDFLEENLDKLDDIFSDRFAPTPSNPEEEIVGQQMVADIYNDVMGASPEITEDDDLEDRCASGHTN